MACFRSISNCFLMALLVLAVSLAPAHAADKVSIDKAGAEKLRIVVEKAVKNIQDSARSGGKALTLEGPVMVEPSGTYYAVTLPGLTYGAEKGLKHELGMVAINAMPAARPGQWKMTIAIPTPISHFDEKQELAGLTTIGSQNFAGIFHEGMGAFTKLNAVYGDIAILDAERKPVLSIKNITIASDMTENDKGEWSGPFDMIVSGLATDHNGTKISADKIGMKSGMTNYALSVAEDYRTKLSAVTENYESGEGGAVSMQHVLGLYNLVTEFIGKAWDGFDATFYVENFALSTTGKKATTINLKSGAYGMGMHGMRNNDVSMNMKLAYDGLAITPRPAQFDTTTPDRINLELSLNKLPYNELIGLGRQSLQMTAAMPQQDMAKLALIGTLAQVPQLLTQAQSNLTIKNSTFGNPLYDVGLDAMAVANLKAQLSATGNATLKVRGMETLTDSIKARAAAKDTPADQKERLQKMLQTMTMLQVASTKQKAANGDVVHIYNFELGENGKIILNGTDMSALLPAADTKKKK